MRTWGGRKIIRSKNRFLIWVLKGNSGMTIKYGAKEFATSKMRNTGHINIQSILLDVRGKILSVLRTRLESGTRVVVPRYKEMIFPGHIFFLFDIKQTVVSLFHFVVTNVS